ncbi:hypothetical protein Rhom172_2824 (plasmid) [Rhodothermus marinus SG0.5JP17-172]|uniref:hypothetical protein n=1 Tax=Rhodothermus marinus TaxID=29549 RepID=UPI000223D529|nr:hypothetical protein [Rhodothermus marinus]AEN74707.1 hypothetical protein Rhom172_2824 [Rhodothermus marinus SG0.5JP17-172]
MIGQELGKTSNMTPNDLPDGYRLTELGPLPEEWRVVRFEQAILPEHVRVGSLKQSEYEKVGKYPVIDQGQNISCALQFAFLRTFFG